MKIHLVRHGKTEANEKKLYCGTTDLQLSRNGAKEIMGYSMTHGYPPPAELYFTSGLQRTNQTAERIYGSGINITTLSDLAEFGFGQFEMRSYEELKERDDYQAWITDATGEVGCPGGENKKKFEARILRGYSTVLRAVEKAVCSSAFVSCHSGTITCIMEHLMPGQKNFYEWQPKTGHGYTLNYLSGQFQGYTQI